MSARNLCELVEEAPPDGAPVAQPPTPAPRRRPTRRRPDLADVRGQPLARRAARGRRRRRPPPAAHRAAGRGQDDARPAPARPAAAARPRRRRWRPPWSTRPPGCRCRRAGWSRRPPFRAPHHARVARSAWSAAARAHLRPGEISLRARRRPVPRRARRVPRRVLDALRQPLEEGVVRVARARATVEFPARFLLVGGHEPVPVRRRRPPGACRCSDGDARSATCRRLSGPLLDRFDLRVEVERARRRRAARRPAGRVDGRVVARVRSRPRRGRGARRHGPTPRIPGAALDELAPLTEAARQCCGASSSTTASRPRPAPRPPGRPHDRRPRGATATIDEEWVSTALKLPHRPARACPAGRVSAVAAGARPRVPPLRPRRELPAEAYAAALAALRDDGAPPAARPPALGRPAAAPCGRASCSGRAGGCPRSTAAAESTASSEPDGAGEAGRVESSALWARCQRPDRRGRPRSAGLPGACSPTTRGRRRCCSCEGSVARLAGAAVAIVGTRNATAAARTSPPSSGATSPAPGVARRVRPGPGHRRRAHRGRARRRGRRRRRSASSAAGSTSSTRAHRRLWDGVAERGLLLSEAPPGTPPEAWRFPPATGSSPR